MNDKADRFLCTRVRISRIYQKKLSLRNLINNETKIGGRGIYDTKKI